MMITLNRVGDFITGSLNGEPFGVAFDEQKYALMQDLLQKANAATTVTELQAIVEEFKPMTQESYKELVEHAKGGQFLFVNNSTGKVYLAIDGKTSNKPLPQSLVDRIITSVEKKIDVLPLVKAWARFLRNPWYSDAKAKNFAQYINTTVVNQEMVYALMDKNGLSGDAARGRATMYDISFTQEGLLATYKVVREIDWKFVRDDSVKTGDKNSSGVSVVDRFEFTVDDITGVKTYEKPEFLEQRVFEPCVMGQTHDAFHCGADSKPAHVIRVGQQVFLDSWDKVDTNDTASCVKGLHVGGLRYIKNYQGEGTITLNVFVDPMHIGGIDHQGTGALRVLKFYPHSAMSIPSQSIYHSSTYAAMTDEEYRQLIAEAVAKTEDKKKELEVELEQKSFGLGDQNGGPTLTIQS